MSGLTFLLTASDMDPAWEASLTVCGSYGFLVSKETVALRRWGGSKQKFGFIKRIDKG